MKWICTKRFMNCQQISYQEQLLEAAMKRESTFSAYKSSKYIFSFRHSQLYTFLGLGNILLKLRYNLHIYIYIPNNILHDIKDRLSFYGFSNITILLNLHMTFYCSDWIGLIKYYIQVCVLSMHN